MWLGEDDTMQGVSADARAPTVSSINGCRASMDWAIRSAAGGGCRRQAAQAPYTRSAAPFLGEIAEGPDGNMYQWVQGVDGLGQSRSASGNASEAWRRRALPIAQRIAPFIPGASAALTAATPFLKTGRRRGTRRTGRALRSAGRLDVPGSGRRCRRQPRRVRRRRPATGLDGRRRAEWLRCRRRISTASLPTTI